MNGLVSTDTVYEELLGTVMERLPAPLLLVDTRHCIFHLNPAAGQLLGGTVPQLLGMNLDVALGDLGDELAGRLTSMVEAALRSEGGPQTPQHDFIEVADAWRGVLEVHVTPLQVTDDVRPAGAMIMMHDVTAQWSRTNELHYQATHDSLTGLINRHEFEQRLGEFIHHHGRTGVCHALCFIDLDRFKSINDRYGHPTGDRLLSELGKYMLGQLRKGDVLGRLGGDEFGLILGSCSGREAVHVAQGLQRAIAAFRFDNGNGLFQVAASIGVADIGGRQATISELFETADRACYTAKRVGDAGRASVVVHSDEQQPLVEFETGGLSRQAS